MLDRGRKDEGFTLVEILVAMVLLAMAILPILQAYEPVFSLSKAEEEIAVFNNQARATLYRVAGLPFENLERNQGDPVDLATVFGSVGEVPMEIFSLQGQTCNPRVTIADVSGGQGGLLEITVSVGHVNLKTLKAKY